MKKHRMKKTFLECFLNLCFLGVVGEDDRRLLELNTHRTPLGTFFTHGISRNMQTVESKSYKTMKNVTAALALTATSASFALLVTLSRINGTYEYNFGTVVLFAEILKLIITSLLLTRDIRNKRHLKMTTRWRVVVKYLVPSLVYTLQNNIQFMTLKYVDPMTYEALRNVNIVTTGLMFRIIFGRKLSQVQWLSLLLLTTGITTSQLTCDKDAFRAPLQGYLWGALSAFLSAFAGVYTEKVMKEVNDSLHWQNMQIYTFGIVSNVVSIIFGDAYEGFSRGNTLSPSNVLRGYDSITWLLILMLSSTGLIVSFIIKYADAGSILKVYASTMAVFPVTLVSMLFFEAVLTIHFVLGMVTALTSLLLYYGIASPSLQTWM